MDPVRLKREIEERSFHDGKRILLSIEDSRKLAISFEIHPLVIEKCALENGIIPRRYERNIGVLGVEGQLKLLCSSIAVIGCGGLGGVIVEILSRAGIGCLILVDGDSFSEDNLNRQLLSSEAFLGRLKVEAAAERIAAVNSAVRIVSCPVMLQEDNIRNILNNADMAVDALDNNTSRKMLYETCYAMGIPVIHGAVGGLIGQMALYYPGNRTHLDLFSNSGISEKGVETVAGVPSFSPFVIASLQAARLIEEITGITTGPGGKLVLMDMSTFHSEILDLGPGTEG